MTSRTSYLITVTVSKVVLLKDLITGEWKEKRFTIKIIQENVVSLHLIWVLLEH